MNEQAYFTERQQFHQVWIWVLLILFNMIFIGGIIAQYYYGFTLGYNPLSTREFVILETITVVVTIFFILLRLDTVIDNTGVHYRFFPFHVSKRTISWDRISSTGIRKYNPLFEYGGWGLRIGLFGKGWAMNVSGNRGLQLIYDKNKKLLIGTQKAEELHDVLKQLDRATE